MKRVLFGVLAILLGVLLACTILEFGLRVSGVGSGSSEVESDPIFHHVHRKNISFLSFSPDGEFNAGRLYYGPDGFIARPGGATPATAKCRVAFLGDSFTEALQVPYAESFVGRLEDTSACKVKNYGVGSSSPVLYLLEWERIIRDWKPDFVVLQLYSNDIRDDEDFAKIATYDREGTIVAVPGPNANIAVELLRKSVLFRLLRRTQQALGWQIMYWDKPMTTVSGYVEEFPDISPLTSGMVKKLNRQIVDAGAKLAIFVVPSKFRLINRIDSASEPPEFSDRWKGWATENDVVFIDMLPAFRASAQNGQIPFFANNIHFNALGHELAARTICQQFPQYFNVAACR